MSHYMTTLQDRETVFHYCAEEGNIDVLKAILAGLHSGQIQLAVNKQSKNGWSPLIVAASRGHVEAVKVRHCDSGCNCSAIVRQKSTADNRGKHNRGLTTK